METKLAQVYHKRQKEVKRGIQNFWNSERGAFATFLENGEQSHYDKLTNALILSADGCTKAQSDMVLQQLTERNGILSDITLGCRFFLYEALMRQPDRYGRWVMEDIARIWGNSLFLELPAFGKLLPERMILVKRVACATAGLLSRSIFTIDICWGLFRGRKNGNRCSVAFTMPKRNAKII